MIEHIPQVTTADFVVLGLFFAAMGVVCGIAWWLGKRRARLDEKFRNAHSLNDVPIDHPNGRCYISLFHHDLDL